MCICLCVCYTYVMVTPFGRFRACMLIPHDSVITAIVTSDAESTTGQWHPTGKGRAVALRVKPQQPFGCEMKNQISCN